MNIEIKDETLVESIENVQKMLVKAGVEEATNIEAVVDKLLWKGLEHFARAAVTGLLADKLMSALMPKEPEAKAGTKGKKGSK